MGLLQFIAARFATIDQRPAPVFATHTELGHYGEEVALAMLQRHAYRALRRNYDCPQGEIDLICSDGPTLVFIEVKTRRSTQFGRPADAVHPGKQQRLVRAAQHYLQSKHHPAVRCRFDVVEVEVTEGQIPQCRIVRDAFSDF